MMTTPDDWCLLALAIFVGASLFVFVIEAILYKLAEVGVYP